MSSVDEAKEYLQLMRTLPTEHRGPLPVFADLKASEPLAELSKKVYQGITKIDERTYRAVSPWHAAAWMLDQATLIAQLGSSDKVSGLVAAYQAQYGAPAFRGQRDPSWDLKPTIFRTATSPPYIVLGLELFIGALYELMDYEENDINTRFVNMAAAQHYGGKTKLHDGMPTPLLDFSADPRVAVYFACNGANPQHDREVVVYGMPLSSMGNSGRIMLPPPWLKRLWAQRGLFLDCTKIPQDVDLRKRCFQVLFPPDAEFAHSMFEKGDEALLPPDPWFEKAIAAAIARAKHPDAKGVPPSLGEWLRQECGDPPFRWFALMPADIQEHTSRFVDMCEWLALKFTEGEFHYDANTFDIMLKDNEQLFRTERATYQVLKKELGLTGVPQHRILYAMAAISQVVEEAVGTLKPQ